MIASYYYDPFGRRLWKEVGGVRTYFHYSDEGLVGEYNASGIQAKAYGYKPDSTWGTDPLFMKEGGEYYYYHNDHLGTPQKLTRGNGEVVWSAFYSSFGEAQVIPSSTVTNNFRFAGQYYDQETGLHYNYHRYYDPAIGRYLTPDPIGLAGGVNLYSYVQNDPVNLTDPRGLFIGSAGAKVIGKIMGRSAQEIAVAGRASDSAVSIAIESTGGVPIDAPKTFGYIGDSLQAFGGIQSVGLGTGIVVSASSAAVAPVVFAGGIVFVGGLEIGFAFSHSYERWRGQSLGEDIYDWLHPEESYRPCE